MTGTVVRVTVRTECVEVTVRDGDGAARTFRLDALELRRPGRRGHLEWRAAGELAGEAVQRSLFDDPPPDRR